MLTVTLRLHPEGNPHISPLMPPQVKTCPGNVYHCRSYLLCHVGVVGGSPEKTHRLGIEPRAFRLPGKCANHYTTVASWWKLAHLHWSVLSPFPYSHSWLTQNDSSTSFLSQHFFSKALVTALYSASITFLSPFLLTFFLFDSTGQIVWVQDVRQHQCRRARGANWGLSPSRNYSQGWTASHRKRWQKGEA